VAPPTRTIWLAGCFLPGMAAAHYFWYLPLVQVPRTWRTAALLAGQVLTTRRCNVLNTRVWSTSRKHYKVLYVLLPVLKYSTTSVLQYLTYSTLQSTGACCTSIWRSLRLSSRQEHPAHLLAGSLDPYSHSCASHSPKLISLRHLHHPKGQRDSQNSHHRCWLFDSAAPVALDLSSSHLISSSGLDHTNAQPCLYSICMSLPRCAALPFVLVGTWRHVPCSSRRAFRLTTCFKKKYRLSSATPSTHPLLVEPRFASFLFFFSLCRPRKKSTPPGSS
jgi:hypothetical protein